MQGRADPHPMPLSVVAALVFSTAIVLGCAYLSYRNLDDVARVNDQVTRTSDFLDAAMRLRSVLHAAETGQRGYLLTGDKAYLAPYSRGRAVIGELQSELKRHAAGSDPQQRRVAALDKLLLEKLDEQQSTVDAMDRGDREGALRIVNGKRGFELMEALVTILSEVRAEEVQLRARYKILAADQERAARIGEFVTSAVVLSQILLCYFLLLRYLRQRRDAETRLAAANAGLEDEVRTRTAELRELSRHLMSMREEEKGRIARELHDEMGSSLTAVNMDLMSVKQKLGEDSPLAQRLARAAATLKSTVESMRRIIEDLRPSMLESLGLREALRSWAKEHAERAGVPLTIDIPEELPPLPAGTPIGLFRVAQEALNNAMRHAKASALRLSLKHEPEGVVLEVVDDGVGITARSENGHRTPHGLVGIRERALGMGGTCTIGSGPSGKGTEIRITVPVAKVRPAA